MTVVAAILWLWLAISIGVYGYRIYRRFNKSSATPEVEAKKVDTKASPSSTLGAASALIQNPVAGFATPEAPATPESPTASGPTPSTPTAPGPLEPAAAIAAPDVPPVEWMPPTPNPPDPQIQPVWTAAAPGDLSASERRVPRQPISEAVAGIRLPCDLGPLVGDVSRVDPFDVAFITITHDGDSVRGALAGELVRLGFQVATTSAYRLSASRPNSELVVTIYPNPTAATEGGRPLYPSAGADSVVVRFQA